MDSSGTVAGTPSATGSFSLTVQATDANWPSNQATTTLTLSIQSALSVAYPSAPAGQIGLAYQIVPVVTGSSAAVSWSVASGALPPGLALNGSSGVVAGVPATWGGFNAIIQARDTVTTAIATAPLAISVAPLPLTISTASLAYGAAGSPYFGSLTSTGGTGATTWSIAGGALPAGLTLDVNGAVSGTPTVAGTSAFTVQATDAAWPGNSATRALTLSIGSRDIVLYAADAPVIRGTWSRVADGTAAGGNRLWNPDLAAPKLTTALANPVNYFELTFQAQAGVPYHLWMRGKADKNGWANDSVYVQFSQSVNAAGVAVLRIGTTSATALSIEDGVNAGLSGWGWQDDSYGGFADPIYFAASGTQTIRVQVREDGLSLDQIVLGAGQYAAVSPGVTKNDTTILAR